MQAGDILGRYEIKEKVGSGGMGEVYRAVDKQLDRDVALKVLLPEFCCDLERVRRFKFEAKAVSSLNHPGIITIHEIVEQDDKLFIATEFVKGVTLRDRIARGDLSLYEAVRIAERVADALAVAHEANIVHRDIKPENVMVRADGYTKVLDFGLAKPIVQAVAGAEEATIQLVKTQPGLVMGSVRYMSPEQARGRETDGTTDVWSLGIVLYEMITGENPFEGETISDSIAALIHKEPGRLADVPDELNWVIRKCLNKRSEERYQNIKDLALDLKEIRTLLEQHMSGDPVHVSGQTASVSGDSTSENKTLLHPTISTENRTSGGTFAFRGTRENTVASRIGFGILPVVILAALMTAAAGWYFSPSLFGPSTVPFQSLQVSKLTDNGSSHSAAVSPDGRFAVFVNAEKTQSRLMVQQIASGSTVEIVPPTSKSFRQPVFSRDGNFVYYVLIDSGLGTLFRVPTLGGKSEEIVVDIDSRPALTSDDKRVAFIRHNPVIGGDTVYLVNSDGKDLKAFAHTSEIGFDKLTEVIWTEGDEKMLLAGLRTSETPTRKASLITIDGATGKPVESSEFALLAAEDWTYVSNFNLLKDGAGYLFIGRRDENGTRQVWNLKLAEERIDSITTDTSDYESLSVSDDGRTIIASKADRISGLVELTPQGEVLRQMKNESKNFMGHMGIAEMPDGSIVYPKMEGRNVDLFLMDKSGESEKALTNDEGVNVFPAVTPDGKYIVFSSTREDMYAVWRMGSDGSDPVRLTGVENGKDMTPQITSDGKHVVFVRQMNDGSKGTLMVVPVEGGNAEPLFPGAASDGVAPQISEDGKRLAYLTFAYDEKSAEFTSSVMIADLQGRKAVNTEKAVDHEIGQFFRWKPASNSMTFINPQRGDNLYEISVTSGEEKVLTDFNAGKVMNFIWARNGKSIYAVRGSINSDLVLIKDIAGA